MTIYRERLWPSPWLFISTALVIPASLLVFLPINQMVGVFVAIALYLGCIGLLLLGSPAIEVTNSELVAGKARLPITIIGSVDGFAQSDARMQRGQLLDARAYLLIRGWVDPVLRVEVVDSDDPTPYWLLSTRHPESIAAAIAAARDSAGITPRTPGR